MATTQPKRLAHSPNTGLKLFPSTSSPGRFSLALEAGREKLPGKSALGKRLFFPANAGVTYNDNRDLRIRQQLRQRERQKSSRLKLAKQQLCTCITLFSTFLCRHCTTTTWTVPNFTFYGGLKRTFLDIVFRNWNPGEFAYIWQSKWVGTVAMKIEWTRIHFLSDVFAAVAVFGS